MSAAGGGRRGEEQHLRQGGARAGSGNARGVPDSQLRRGGDRRAPLPPSGRQGYGGCRRGEVHSPMAGDEWNVEGDAGVQLRPQVC